MEFIRFITFLITWFLWAVIGLIFWIPLITRSTATLSAAILYCTLTQSDPDYMKTGFENAVSFYARGFQLINQVHNQTDSKGTNTKPKTVQFEQNWWRVILETIWTLAFWIIILLTVIGFLSFFSIGGFYRSTSSAKEYLLRGQAFVKEEKYALAIPEFNKAIEYDQSLADAYFYRAVSYNFTDNYNSAILDYTQFIKLNPQNPSAYLNRGLIYASKSKELAIQDIKKSIEFTQDPDKRQKLEQYLQTISVK